VDVGGGFFSTVSSIANPLPTLPYTIDLVSSTAGATPAAPYSNLSTLGVAQLEQSGIDELKLQAGMVNGGTSGGTPIYGSIQINTSLPVALAREISLDAPNIGVAYGISATLNAPYIVLTDSQPLTATLPANAGTGSLKVNAQEIALSGFTALQGLQNVTLSSTGDVQLEPLSVLSGDPFAGGLSLAGNLNINAARVFPSTLVSYAINDTGPVATVTVAQSNASPGTPLSAGGALSITAPNIVSSGTILAPFGSIALNAGNHLSLLDGSETSVSGNGALLPLGQTTLNQQEWIYQTGNLTTQITGVPNRQVSLNAPKISFASGATVDVSGGGDLSAYEWVPGTGGAVDSLGAAAASAAGLYAVLPSTRGQYAAFDLQEFGQQPAAGSSAYVAPAESVYLSGVPGLPAGMYPLLPARYGLSPGAFLIQVESGYQSLSPGVLGALPTGAPVIAGYFGFGNTGLQNASGYTGFAVYPGSYSQTLAQYQVSSASGYFGAAAASSGLAQVALPADAGTLQIIAGSTLSALGKVDSQAGPGGTGATIDVSATDLSVVANESSVGSGITLYAPAVQSWAAGDLVLGGVLSTDGSSLAVTANTVTIGAGAQFTAGQVLVVANQSIDVQSGATIASTSGVSGTPLKTLPATTSLDLTGSGAAGAALLAVSDSSLPLAVRPASTGASTPAATIDLESGATLSTRGAVALDAPGSVTAAGTIAAPGASWSLASSSIAFVGANGSTADTLLIGPSLLAQLQRAGALTLTAPGSIDLLTPVTLGVSSTSTTPTLSALTLNTASINSAGTATSQFAADTLTLLGQGTAPVSPVAGSAGLILKANAVELGAGELAINGDAQTAMHAIAGVVGEGLGSLAVGGNLSITAAYLTAATPAPPTTSDTASSATGTNNVPATVDSLTAILVPGGTLQIAQAGAAPSARSLASSLGGELQLSANSIQDSGSIIVPGGQISLTSASDLAVGANATINAGGITVAAGNQVLGAAGGIINLSAGGNLSLPAGVVVSVAGAGAAPGGFLNVTGGGTVTLNASLAGNASGAAGGSFALDAGQLAGGFTALAAALNSGGFDSQVSVRVRSGDLDSSVGSTLSANQIGLTADTGVIDIAGTLSAPSGATRGSIDLYAGQGLVLEPTGTLTANGSGSGGRGGEIELSTVAGDISLDTGSVIAASGQAQMGTLLLRAPANTTTGDVAITGIGSDVQSVGQITIEPVLPVYNASNFPGGDPTAGFSAIQSDISNYLTLASSTIPTRLQPAGSAPLLIEPGVVIEASGALALSQVLDLDALQLGAPIDLTVRATGALTINGTVSDGIENGVLSSSAPSSTLRFVAGADLTSANPLAVVAGSGADLSLNALLTTGTGDIDLVASRNVVFGANASAFTTGLAVAPPVNVRLQNSNTDNFPTDGGNVIVSAGQDVMAQPVAVSITSWQLRNAKNDEAFWGVNLNAFEQNPWSLATFGGGDLRVSAGRDADNLSAAAADSLMLSASGVQTLNAGGGMTVNAGRDITTGQFFVADGVGTLNAGRSFAANLGTSSAPVGSLFALQNSQISLWSEDGIAIAAILNPTVLPQVTASGGAVPGTGAGAVFFYSYGTDAALNAQSSSGDVILQAVGSPAAPSLAALLGSTVDESEQPGLAVITPNLRLASLTQDIALTGTQATLYPSSKGQLQLFAGQDIVNEGVVLAMSDAPASDIPTAVATNAGGTSTTNTVGMYPFYADVHADDPTPASFVAGRDIVDLYLSVPKASQIEAGRDIVNLSYYGQNLNPTDMTLISAGRDFDDTLAFGANGGFETTGIVQVGGPGALDVLAGRNINLGFSPGVTTIGNLVNANLNTATGASITMIAGLGQSPDDSAFYQDIIKPSSTYQQQLVGYVESINGASNLSVTQADADFVAFNPALQQAFVDNVFFNELNLSGLEANENLGVGFSRGYAAIDALFPESRSAANPYSGDLDLLYSEIYSISGGSISLLVPGGAINVGLANPPASVNAKPASQLGIVAQGTGNVDIYSEGSVNVDTSRIFTLGGGNILIWSDEGSIDAGNGAKTSLSVPPPTVEVTSSGNVELVYDAAVAGSGIRTIQTSLTEPAGNVDLIAPEGSVNAGDAGIAAAGDINIAAVAVTGIANISFGGTATGVPALVSNLTASLSGASSTAASATTSATSSLEGANANQAAAAPLAESAISWLDVFVTGLGEENCKPDDLECLKRQKHE
jgi:filamentous hemagglutinin